ncbi:MAG: hypothetical protein QOI21_414 [Actinomycetota bacterium]|nr:hypothetical protein [Actinomycetota bacterium]
MTLAEYFDTFLLGDLGMFVNIDFESLKGQDDAAARLLKLYCTIHKGACGAELDNMLKDVTKAKAFMGEMGGPGGIGRIGGAAAKIPKIADIARGANLVKVADFLDDLKAFAHYAKHVRGVMLKNGKSTVKAGGPDMPEFGSFDASRKAPRVMMGAGKSDGVIEGIRKSDRVLVRLDQNAGIIGFRSPDGVIKSFFRPTDPAGQMAQKDYAFKYFHDQF